MAQLHPVAAEVLSLMFPNTRIRMADEATIKRAFGDRMVMLSNEPPDMPDDPWKVPREMYQWVPQSHPFWLTWREEAKVTGSVTAKLCLLHAQKSAKKLRLPTSMHGKEQYSTDWETFRLRQIHGRLSRDPFDMPGAVFAQWGKNHEDTACANYLHENPEWVYHERGLVMITDAMLAKRKLLDLFDGGKPFTSFPVPLGDSPDGLLVHTDPKTGETKRRGLELKTGTQFVPGAIGEFKEAAAKYPGGTFVMKSTDADSKWPVLPYPKIKEYYLQQCMFHMLALETDECMFVSWTYGGGMRSWLIKFDHRYVSMLLSILKYIYINFPQRNRQVPNDLGWSTDPAHKAFVGIYKEFLDATLRIVDTTPAHQEVPPAATKEFTEKITERPDSGYLSFLKMPEEYPPFVRMILYARALVPEADGIRWAIKYDQMDVRKSNLSVLTATPLFFFMRPIVDAAFACTAHPATVRSLYVTQSAALEAAEKLMVGCMAPMVTARFLEEETRTKEGWRGVSKFSLNPHFERDYQKAIAGEHTTSLAERMIARFTKHLPARMARFAEALAMPDCDAGWMEQMRQVAIDMCTDIQQARGAAVSPDIKKRVPSVERFVDVLEHEYWTHVPQTPETRATRRIARMAAVQLVLGCVFENLERV